MRKTIPFILAVFFACAGACMGQIGATKAALEERYGKAAPADKMLTSPYDNLVESYYTFQHDNLKIYAGLKEGKTVLLMWQKADKSAMSQKEVFSILEAAVAKADWVLLSGNDPNPRWRLGDSSAYAYYYATQDSEGAPAFFVRVQTAALDAVYTKLRQPDIVPDDPKTPLFRIFEATPASSGKPKVIYDEDRPLLTVYTVRDVVLGRDNKGVMLELNDKDTKTFASLTKKHNDGYLLFMAGKDATELMHITAPIEDGTLEFRPPGEAGIAEYFRKRFKIAEFK